MMNCQDKHQQVIDHLKEKYKLSRNELISLESLKMHTVKSIAFTTEGGFDSKTGEFYLEERKLTYKIRIKFQEKSTNDEKMIFLQPTSGDS